MNPNTVALASLAGRPNQRHFWRLGDSAFVHSCRTFLALAMLGVAIVLDQLFHVNACPLLAAGSKSDYLELKILDHVLGGGDYTRPATVYFGLFSAAPSDSGGGTELTGNNYSRTAITNNSTNFPAAASGSKSNGTQINGPIFSGTTATVVAWGLFDASTSGNLLYWGDLAAGDQKAYSANDQPIIPVGSLTITED